MDWNDHQQWMDQIREMLGLDPDVGDLSDHDLMFVSDLAAKIKRGDVSVQEAFKAVMDHVMQGKGYVPIGSQEEFDLETQFHDMIDVTERVQELLQIHSQPGLADGIVKLYVNPELVIDEDGDLVGGDPGKPAVAVHSKSWFKIQFIDNQETRDLHHAVSIALREHVDTN